MKNTFILYLGIIISPILSYGQGAWTICNSFESTTSYLNIDTTGIWEIGQPTKTIFNGSYTGLNSIVTDLDSLYPINDTSIFYMVYQDEWGYEIPNYLGLYNPLEIEFYHRFIIDSIADHGSIEMSLDNGNTWYDILSSEYNATWNWSGGLIENEHYFESTGETLYDSLEVVGNSNGWVHSKFTKDIEQIISNDGLNPNSILLRFSFITDSVGGNEGWQIDDLCMSMDYIVGIFENKIKDEYSIFPNPNNGEFSIQTNAEIDKLCIYNLLGVEVFATLKTKKQISTNLPTGVYIVSISQEESIYTTRMVIK